MGTSKQLLDWARAQLGTVGGSKYWQQVYGWSGNGLPWCAVFCSAALQATDTPCNYFPNTLAFDKRDMDRIGSAWVDKYKLTPGCILSFSWDHDGTGDHVGIVEKVLGYGVYQTIEGNVSDSVGRRTRYAADIIGGTMPNYEKPIFTDVDSSTPHFDDIKWMKANGITTGYSDGSYRPNSALTRADAAAFIHRLYNLIEK